MHKSWTIFGLGNSTGEVIDAITANQDSVAAIVLNTEVDPILRTRYGEEIKFIDLKEFNPASDYYTLGFANTNKAPLVKLLVQHKLNFKNLIHPFSSISKTCVLEEGNFFGPGVVVSSYVKIGNFNYFNRSGSIGHDCRISNYNHFAPGVTVSGRCTVGDRNFLGVGSILIDGLEIGDDIYLGGGAVAVKDILEPGTYIGVPAKKLLKKK
jgi:sugar O-acyltransferase (sialic acid O-acetyltransferase NeuD family)